MSQLNRRLNESSAKKLYFDLLVSNFQQTIEPSIFQFSETRASPFLLNPENYEMSIVRFAVDTGELPVFIPYIQPNSADRNETIYSCTLSYKGYDSIQSFIQWIPQDLDAEVPDPPSKTFNGLQVNDGGYYNCYSYTYFIFLIYQAMVVAFNDLEAKVIAGGDVLPTAFPPLMNWDSTANSALMYVDDLGYNIALADPIKIFWNAPLFTLFNSFPAVQQKLPVLLGKQYRLVFSNVGGSNIIPITPSGSTTSYNAIQVFQEYSTIESLNPIASLVFTSNSLPIEPNQVSTPLVFNNNQQLSFGGSNNATENIITDLVSDSGLYRPNLVYLPTAEYRRISLTGNTPLYTLDINIFYRLRNSQLIPFRLQSGGSCSMKILFEKIK
jgi:hypothetical protein